MTLNFLLNKSALLKEMDKFINEIQSLRNLIADEEVQGIKNKMLISSKRRSEFDKRI